MITELFNYEIFPKMNQSNIYWILLVKQVDQQNII